METEEKHLEQYIAIEICRILQKNIIKCTLSFHINSQFHYEFTYWNPLLRERVDIYRTPEYII